MKKVYIKKIFLLVISLLVLYSIGKHIWITNTVWEFDRGNKVGEGDFIEFNSKMYSLSLNTIYRKGTRNSKVFKFNFLNGELWLKEIGTDKIGIYVDRDNH